jgi:signal peptidase II
MATRTAPRASQPQQEQRSRLRCRLLLTVAALVAAANALTQAIAVALSHWMPVFLPGGWALKVVHNNGVILGVGAGTGAPDVFAIGAVLQIATLTYVSRNQSGRLWAVALGLLAGAAIGNEGESRIFGYVVDWVWLPHLPLAFNLADVAVACGQVLMIPLLLRARKASARTAVAP